jgi:hypothetical protein
MKRILLTAVIVIAASSLALGQKPDKTADKSKPMGEKVAAINRHHETYQGPQMEGYERHWEIQRHQGFRDLLRKIQCRRR